MDTMLIHQLTTRLILDGLHGRQAKYPRKVRGLADNDALWGAPGPNLAGVRQEESSIVIAFD